MMMQCNINARGKRTRLISGMVFLAIAVGLAICAWLWGSGWLWIVAGFLGFCGAFSIFEARAGWCVVRAMGFKTRV
jgi:hypothetical protein